MFCLTKADKTGKTYKKWALVSPPRYRTGKRSGEHWYWNLVYGHARTKKREEAREKSLSKGTSHVILVKALCEHEKEAS
jgi:hypothetical protein